MVGPPESGSRTNRPLPYVASVIVPITEIIDIDQPEPVIVDHVELVVPILNGRSTPSQRHSTRSYRDETSVPWQTRGQGQTTKDQTKHSHPLRHADDTEVPHSPPLAGRIGYPLIAKEGVVATYTRQECAQILLRVKPADRDRIRTVIPRGSLNSVAVQLLMDYVRVLEAHGPCPRAHLEDPAA